MPVSFAFFGEAAPSVIVSDPFSLVPFGLLALTGWNVTLIVQVEEAEPLGASVVPEQLSVSITKGPLAIWTA